MTKLHPQTKAHTSPHLSCLTRENIAYVFFMSQYFAHRILLYMNLCWSILMCVLFCWQWGSLSSREKEVYFTEAERHKQDHQMQNPGWTNKDNYVSTHRPHIFKVEMNEWMNMLFSCKGEITEQEEQRVMAITFVTRRKLTRCNAYSTRYQEQSQKCIFVFFKTFVFTFKNIFK